MGSQRYLFADVDGFVDDIVHIADTLSNVVYLIEIDAENPGAGSAVCEASRTTAAGAGKPGSLGGRGGVCGFVLVERRGCR